MDEVDGCESSQCRPVAFLRSIRVGLTLHAVAARCRHRRPAAQKKTGLAAAATSYHDGSAAFLALDSGIHDIHAVDVVDGEVNEIYSSIAYR